MDITFDNCIMCIPVYVKMDACDPLLLSECGCHQLSIIRYHPSVAADPPLVPDSLREVNVPVMCVKLIHSVRLPPIKSIIVHVQLEGELLAQ